MKNIWGISMTKIETGYYPNGYIMYECPYENGKAHGIEKWYYESGELESEIPYVNDKIHGVIKHYYKNVEIVE